MVVIYIYILGVQFILCDFSVDIVVKRKGMRMSDMIINAT